MDTQELFQRADLSGLHNEVAQQIRQNPQDASSRALFVQILCLEGAWERADKQADALMKLSPSSARFCSTVSQLIRAEQRRESVLRGEALPVWAGSVPSWGESLTAGMAACTRGDLKAGAEAIERVLEALPVVPVTLSGRSEPWLLDGDARFSGVLELITGGEYRLVEQATVQELEIAAPTHPIELLWPHVRLSLRSGEILIGRMPGRYPLTAQTSSADAQLLLMRSTAWTDCDNGLYLGEGQRCWNAESGTIPLLTEPVLRWGELP